ncbi:ABC transporter substrate-binding protein [Streptomyces sp. NPDC051940]|uniref:ABC transporter substrate-binding protein n=1 Tax=Streptomyces sp. NPDC051940 TaxID=3155675 RepID=UPI0034237515
MTIRVARTHAIVAALAAGAIALTGCSSGGGSKENEADKAADKKAAEKQQAQIEFGDAAASTGPAPEIKGAKTGGEIIMLQRDPWAHLDPAQIYVADEGALSRLIHRGLTGYKNVDGKQTVVGDLATDSGQTTDGGKTWKYTLKDGIKWADGTDITSKDVRHTFERQFADFVNQGPTYIQAWLADVPGTDYRKLLPGGPYKGKHLPDSILATPDDKTITFTFKTPHPDFPYALAMPGYAMVSAAKDTKEKYDKNPMTSGPYKIESQQTGKSMKLVRNDQWDPKTDVTRNAYPDSFNIELGVSEETYGKRVIADNGADKNIATFSNSITGAQLQELDKNAGAKARSIPGVQPYVGQLNINMDRVKDVKVRQAIAYALPIKAFQTAFGGPKVMDLAGGLVSPTVAGYEEGFDPFGKLKNPLGDIEKAKSLLEEANAVGTKLTMAYGNTPQAQQYSAAYEDALKKAGFDVQRKELAADTYYDQVSLVKNSFDIYPTAWGADWPSASTVIPPLYDGRQIQDGASNYAHINDPKVNSEIDRINLITDPAEAAKEWNKLAQYIVKDVVSNIPVAYYKQVQMWGSNVGGAVYDDVIGEIDPRKLYVK